MSRDRFPSNDELSALQPLATRAVPDLQSPCSLRSHVFEMQVGLMEAYGRGTLRTLDLWREAVWRQQDQLMTLWRNQKSRIALLAAQEASPTVTHAGDPGELGEAV